MHFKKLIPVVSYDYFVSQVRQVNSFTSATGRRYAVQDFENGILCFIREDAKNNRMEMLDIAKAYEAYKHLTDFKTEHFRPFVPRQHAPARGLLLHLGLIE